MSFVENKRNCLSVRAADAGKWIGKYAPTAGLALLCVLTAASVYLGIFVAAERLHAAWAFNTGEETFCVMVCVLMYFGCFVDRKNAAKSIRMFMVLLLCAFLGECHPSWALLGDLVISVATGMAGAMVRNLLWEYGRKK